MELIVLGLVLSIAAIGLALSLRAYWLSRFPKRALNYRRRYQQLTARMEAIVTRINSLANLVPHVKNSRVLDDFESCLRMMETLLLALSRTPNFGFNPARIDDVQPLVKRVEVKIDDTYKKFKKAIEERPLFAGLLARWQKETEVPAKGCYFCSRPYMREYFKASTIIVEGIHLRVYGCQICVAELKTKKTVKVLYFQEHGRPVHWSLVGAYQPAEQYWQLNRHKPSYQTPKIVLVE